MVKMTLSAFPGLPRIAEEEIRQVILHEFGHAIGLIHEHQSPAADIPWDSAAVYKYYWESQDPPWDPPKVDRNIFYRYDDTTTNYSTYDPLSIMHYRIDDTLTKGTFSTDWNFQLSDTDKKFIKKIYPMGRCNNPPNCCYDKKGKLIPCSPK